MPFVGQPQCCLNILSLAADHHVGLPTYGHAETLANDGVVVNYEYSGTACQKG